VYALVVENSFLTVFLLAHRLAAYHGPVQGLTWGTGEGTDFHRPMWLDRFPPIAHCHCPHGLGSAPFVFFSVISQPPD
jgi:hypothetical protein